MRYEDFDQAVEKTLHTYIKHKEHWVQVIDRNRRTKTLHAWDVFRNVLEIPFEDLDLTPPKLGYCNHNGKITYVTRIPIRNDWRQGLRMNTVRFVGPELETLGQLHNTVNNHYPSFEEALETIDQQQNYEGVAFSRRFAITKDRKILYKRSRVVGTVKDKVSIEIEPRYSYLSEQLDRSIKGN